jgi:hypothetical protein
MLVQMGIMLVVVPGVLAIVLFCAGDGCAG